VFNWNCSYLLSSLFKKYMMLYHWEMKNKQSLVWLCERIFPCWYGIKLIESKLGSNEEIRMWTSLVSKLPFQEWIQLWNFLHFKIETYALYHSKSNFGFFCWMLEISCAYRRDIIVVMHKVTRNFLKNEISH
jgi:hypothetical protein